MPRPDPRAPQDGQAAMFDAEVLPSVVPGRVTRGRHSEAIDRAFVAASDADLLRPEHEALQTVVRSVGWALDCFEQQNKPYGPAKLVPAAVEALRELCLTPAAQADATDDDLRTLLDEIARPTTGDADAPLPHTSDTEPA
ncbi:hypothetical protein [Nocardia sp. N2S4-5]|uniref:hypothetical protein n=1 Tax=Nocardia sp. N2S4-5 TaxID=3351565 RepID=UPI0037CD6794